MVRNKTYGEPEIIISDFEKAAMNAAMNVFPATEFFGCLFHLTQNVFRHIEQVPEVLARCGDIQCNNISKPSSFNPIQIYPVMLTDTVQLMTMEKM